MIAATAAALRTAGYDVQVDVDASSRAVADIETDRADRADRRAEGLRFRADRLAVDAVVAADRADRAADRVPPMGEPIKVGHHSEMPHRRAIDRAHQAMGVSVAADEAARAADQRAAAAAATTGARYSPSTVANRIARLRAEERRTRRELDGYTRTTADTTEDHAPADSPRREQLLQRHQDYLDQISYWTEVRRQQLEAGQAPGYTAATVSAGDLVVVRGRVRRVVRANKTTATIRSDHSWNDRVPWHEVRDLVTGISVPDPDSGPGGMPIYEGLTPELKLVDGTYMALLSTDRRPEPLAVGITVSDGRLTAPPALTTPNPPHPVRNDL